MIIAQETHYTPKIEHTIPVSSHAPLFLACKNRNDHPIAVNLYAVTYLEFKQWQDGKWHVLLHIGRDSFWWNEFFPTKEMALKSLQQKVK